MRCRSAAEDEAAVLAMGEFARGFRRSRGPVFEAPVQKRHLLLGRHLVQELARRAPPPARRGDRIKRFLFFVAMDVESWRHDTHGRITLQEIHGVEVGFPVDSQFRQPRLTCQVTRMHSCD